MRFENTSGVAGSIKNKSGQFRPLYRGNKMTDEERAERIIRSKMSIEEAFSK